MDMESAAEAFDRLSRDLERLRRVNAAHDAPGAPGSAPGALGPDVVDDQGAAADVKPGAAMMAIDWDARLRAAVGQTLATRQARRDERDTFRQRRTAGLRQRHLAKLSRSGKLPPCCAELDEPPCPQHRQAHEGRKRD